MRKRRDGYLLDQEEMEQYQKVFADNKDMREKLREQTNRANILQNKNEQLQQIVDMIEPKKNELEEKEKYLKKKINKYNRKLNDVEKTLAVAQGALNFQKRKSYKKEICSQIVNIETCLSKIKDGKLTLEEVKLITPIDISIDPENVIQIYDMIMNRWCVGYDDLSMKLYCDRNTEKWTIYIKNISVYKKNYSNLIDNLVKVDL